MELETVRVVSPVSDQNPHGYIVINMDDLADDHELFVEPTDEKPAEKAAEKAQKAPAKAEKPVTDPETAAGLGDNAE